MSSEPSSPMDPKESLRKEIRRLKEQYKTLESDFAYYEDSNGKLQKQVDEQGAEIDKKDLELTYLKELIDRTTAEQDTTYEEVENLRRRSSVLETKIKSQGVELKNTVEAERLLVDREAEVRHFTAELHEVKTDRDDKLAEVKGLEGDLERQMLALEAKDLEIDSLHERIDIFERHIRITKALPLEELDDCLYDFVEKVAAKEGDVVASFTKKAKRKSLSTGGGFNLADEFDALSDDEEYESGDDEGSDTRSVLSDASVRSRKRRAKQVLGMSALQAVEIHPSINKPTMTSTGTQMSPISPKTIKPLPQMTSTETQTSPIQSPVKPQTTSIETQTSPIALPVKAQITSTGTQYSPIASPAKFAAPNYASNETQTSPLVSPIKAQISSTETQTSPVASPIKAQITSTGTQYSPINSPIRDQVTSTGTQYSPIASPVKSKYASNETQTSLATSPIKAQTTTTETQTSPVASPVKPKYASNETQTSPVASSPQKEAAQTRNSGIQTSPIPSPRKSIFEMISSFETISSAVQTSPIVATVAKLTPGTASQETQTSPTASSPKDTNSAVQTSPVAASPRDLVSPTTGTEVQTSLVSTSPGKAISETPESEPLQSNNDANAQQNSSSQPQSAANSGVQPRRKHALLQLPETRATSSSFDTSSTSASPCPSNINILNTKRPRVPAKDTTPTTLSPLKSVTTPSTDESVSTTLTLPNGSTPDLVTVPNFWQHAYLQPQAMFLYAIAGYVGYLIANALHERQWAEVNGYAPENGIIYIGKHILTGLWGIFLAILAFFWHAVFGEWVAGGGYQRPLSPG